MKTDAAFEWPAGIIVLGTVTGKDFDPAIVHFYGERDLNDALRAHELRHDVLVYLQYPLHFFELLLRAFERIVHRDMLFIACETTTSSKPHRFSSCRPICRR